MNLNFSYYIYEIPAIVFAMTLHGYVKALLSTRLGDTTPRDRGRLTLDPFKQIEVVGFALMLLFGYGWTLPVETNPMMYKDRKKGTLIVNIVPSLVVLVMGVVFTLVAAVIRHTLFRTSGVFVPVFFLFSALARYFIALAVFNVIPVYPMDGWWVLNLFLSPNARVKMSNNEKIFQVVLVALLVLGAVRAVLDPVCGLILGIIQ